MATWLGSLLGPAGPLPAPPPAAAATPQPATCQSGLFQPTAPRQVACSADATGSTKTATGANGPAVSAASGVLSGFQETTVWSGLTNPTVLRFAADGRVFVAEKSGAIKVFSSLSDTTPDVFTGLQTNVDNYWDRGLLGMALDPKITNGSGGNGDYVYVLYAYDHVLGSASPAPRWGDACPSPPNPTLDGCVISARLSRFAVSGTTISGPETVLIEDWCQQFPSHSIGNLQFGADGSLYVSAGDGASFITVDYGEFGGSVHPTVVPLNPCGDPPGGKMTTTISEGGALRAQDVRTSTTYKSYALVVSQDSPIADWRLGEASGTTAVDSVGTSPGNHPGTYVGSPTLGVSGALLNDTNTAVTFDGTSQAMTVADSSALRFAGTAAFSVEAWVNQTPDGSSRRIAGAEDGSGDGWALYSNGTTFGFRRSSGGSVDDLQAGTPIGGGWVHVMATYDGTTMRLYRNGLEVANGLASSGSLPSDSTFAIGRSFGPSSLFFNGSLDEVSIYGSALNGGLASAHHDAGIKTGGDPVGLDGAILRVNPTTGAAMSGNPFGSSSDLNARRIIAYGFRNPFRFTIRPGTNELWIGDVGWNDWEEINRIPSGTDSIAENFGWPCFEGVGQQSGYAVLDRCKDLYPPNASTVTAPYYTYNHGAKVVSSDPCPTGGSSITGLAFYPGSGGDYPSGYGGGLFFADHTRNCIWFMPKGGNGLPDPSGLQSFVTPAVNPVDLEIGPAAANFDLFYVDFGDNEGPNGGSIRRISVTGPNQPPVAVIDAQPTSGSAPLTVDFDASGSSDPEGSPLTYAWDLDGDGQYDDATGAQVSHQYTAAGSVNVGLRVTDSGGAAGTAQQQIIVGNDPPVPVIDSPSPSLTYAVNDVIAFSGHATDNQDGTLDGSALSWTLIIHHCPSNCHTHIIQTDLQGTSGTFNAPDHDYPSYLELVLTAKDSSGVTASTSVILQPKTVNLTFHSSPSGLALVVGASASGTPFTRTVIVGSANSVSAQTPYGTPNGFTYNFVSWSDGGAASHTIMAPASPTTYTATYKTTSYAIPDIGDTYVRSTAPRTNYGRSQNLGVKLGQLRTFLKFKVTGLTSPPASVKLRLWVTGSSYSGGAVYKVPATWTETGLTWRTQPWINPPAVASLASVSAGHWVDFVLAPKTITANGTYAFAISGGSDHDEADYASRESTHDPVLIITR